MPISSKAEILKNLQTDIHRLEGFKSSSNAALDINESIVEGSNRCDYMP